MKPYGRKSIAWIKGGNSKKHKERGKCSCAICYPKVVNKRFARRNNNVYRIR